MAEEKYENEYNFPYLYWMHFIVDDDQVRVFYKTRTNNNVETAQQLIDVEYDDWMTGGTGEEEANAFRDDENLIFPNCSDGSVYCFDEGSDILSLSWDNIKTWRSYCCLMEGDTPAFYENSFRDGVLYGVIDGIWMIIVLLEDNMGGKSENAANFFSTLINPLSWSTHLIPVGKDFVQNIKNEGNLFKGIWAKFGNDANMIYESWSSALEFLINFPAVWNAIKSGVNEFMGGLDPRSGLNTSGYAVGQILFEVLMDIVTTGEWSIWKAGKNTWKVLEKIGKNPQLIVENLVAALNKSENNIKKLICKIKYAGCFVAGTPVLMAYTPGFNENIDNKGWTWVSESENIIAMPIEDVQLFDYVLANNKVNSSQETQDDGILASTNKGFFENNENAYIAPNNYDPFTSSQQLERDHYVLDDEHWKEVVFEEVYGTSICKLALHNDWINKKGYSEDVIVNMDLPEQGISGPFKITSIKHIIPQKKPLDEDSTDDYEFRPVTALFLHNSDQVWNLTFSNDEIIGVTFQHPVYSVSARDWVLAGQLKIGEKVLTKTGEAEVTGKEKKRGFEPVYNLEVKGLHNFLVGDSGMLVHNSCGWMWNKVRTYGVGIQETCLQHIKRLHLSGSGLNKSHFGSHINDSNIRQVLQRVVSDYADNASNMKFIENGYSQGKHWIIVDMTPHADLLDEAGNIGRYISQSGATQLDVKHILITVDENLEMINAFPTNKILIDFP